MNFNLYIFGSNKGTYNQYPNDYTSSILSALCNEVDSSKAIIARDQNLMHYIYAENLGDSNILGICLIFNTAYVKQVNEIFNFLRGIIESTLLKDGRIIRYNRQGDIEFVNTNISDDIKSYEFVKTIINSRLDSDNNFGLTELRTIYNGLHNSEVVDGGVASSEIIKLQQKFNKIIIDYKCGIDEDLTRQVISGLQDEIVNLKNEIANQAQEITRLERTKKQFKKVIFLCVVLLCACVGLYFLYNTLDETKRNLENTTASLDNANETIKSQESRLTQNYYTISSLRTELTEQRRQKEEAQSALEGIKSFSPIVVTGTSCSLYSGEFTIEYYSFESETKSLTIRVYNQNTGRFYPDRTYSSFFEVGSGSLKLRLNYNFNPSDWHIFEIWHNGRLIGGGRY